MFLNVLGGCAFISFLDPPGYRTRSAHHLQANGLSQYLDKQVKVFSSNLFVVAASLQHGCGLC